MSSDIKLEFLKLRVPLSQAWGLATKSLLAHEDRNTVEELTLLEAADLEKAFYDVGHDRPADSALRTLARDTSFSAVQMKFSGSLPSLPERDADLISQHSSVWSLIAKLMQNSTSNQFPKRVFDLAATVLERGYSDMNTAGDNWKQRARSILESLICLKGQSDERIVSLCSSDTFLCERDLVVPSVKIVTKSKQFKELMSAPDMISDGEKTLPRLLTNLCEDKEFRRTFVWLPLDPENPLNQSGGSGVIPTDKKAYRFVLSIIMKILFGKLRQRGHGIDKRSSFQERQNQIMTYLGSVPVSEMTVVFETLFGRVVSQGIEMDQIQMEWKGSEFIDKVSGLPVLNREFIQVNHAIKMGVLQLMTHIVSQMKRKVDAFVPLLSCYVVSLLAWTDLEEDKGKSVHKISLLRLGELMTAYCHVGANVWNQTLAPVTEILMQHLERSSRVELSTVFRMVTSWSRNESLIDLYSLSVGAALLPVIFSARQMSGKVSKSLFECVLILCGENPDESSARASSYQNSRRQKIREHMRTGGADEESGDDELDDSAAPEEPSSSKWTHIVLEHASSILTSISLSMSGELELRVTVSIAKLASQHKLVLPLETCAKLLELLAEMLKRAVVLSSRKKKGSGTLCIMFEAIAEIASLVPSEGVPPCLLASVTNCVSTLDDVRGRLSMSRSILALSQKVSPEEVASAQLLVKLNAVRGLQPDVDMHVDVLQDLLEGSDEKIFESAILVKQCLFLLAREACDSTVRHCAERFVTLSCSGSEGEEELPFSRLVMIMSQIHRMLGMMSSEPVVHKSALKILTAFVRDSAIKIDPKSEYARLLHRDLIPFVAILDELQHLQKHRRARALGKLVECEISDYTRKTILVPLALEAVLQPGVAKANFNPPLADTGIRAVQSCSSMIEIAVTLLKVHLRRVPEREKVVFRACQKIAEHLRLDQQALERNSKSLAKVSAIIVPVLKRKIWDSKGSLKGGEGVDKHRLAGKDKEAKEGIVKIDAVVALLEFVQLLSTDQLNQQVCQLVRIVVQGLPSRELENRRAAREALRRCAKAMGPSKTAYLMKEVRCALPRGGYQAGVAVFTCFSILEAMQSVSDLVWGKSVSLAVSEEVLHLLRIEDTQWAALQSKTNSAADGLPDPESEIARQCIEVKRHKGHELLKLASKILNPACVTSVLLRSVYQLLNSVEGYVDHEISDEENEMEDVQQQSDSGGSDDEDKEAEKEKTRKRKKVERKNVQLNACYGKKYFSRTETALTHVVDGMLENKGFQAEERLALSVQALAQFEDIASRKFRLEEARLFSSNQICPDVLRVDFDPEEVPNVAKRARVDLRQKQKENTFLVQPGASTGKGHWVTEEWRKGNIANPNPLSSQEKGGKTGSVDLRAVKARILGSVGLKILNLCTVPADDVLGIRTALAKFVTRAFLSGISELFQASAKAVQKLMDAFNPKAKGQIAKKLIQCMEQLHHSGSDLSFITLKQQRKAAQAEVASTCSALLLTLMNAEERQSESSSSEVWLNQVMVDTLAAHVRASLDVSALQVSALAILKKIVSFKKFKSATLYDCLNSVGGLLVSASSQRVCASAGQLYAHFLVEFPHTEKSLMAKLLVLLKQAQTSSAALSRCTALNTIYTFVRVVPSKSLQEVFGEIIFVSLAVTVSCEEDASAKQMIVQVLLLVLSRFSDQVKRNRLVEAIAGWPKTMNKHQFVFSAAEVCSLVCKEGLLGIQTAASVVEDVIRQIPFCESDLIRTQGHLSVVESVSALVQIVGESSDETASQMGKILQFSLAHSLRFESAHVSVVTQCLRLAGSVKKQVLKDLSETPTLIKEQLTGSIEPWPLMIRVLRVLVRPSTESHLEIACVAMRTIAHLLPLCTTDEVREINFQAQPTKSESHDPELGLFQASLEDAQEHKGIDESLTVKIASESERLSSLLKKIRFEVRGLMARSRESTVRLASLLKLTTALTLSVPPSQENDVLTISLEILVRLATINKVAEEVSTEVPEVNSLFELSTLRPIEQIGCLCKMANGGIEALEKHFKQSPAHFTKQLTAVTAGINKGRRDRKISLLNLAVSNPGRLAMLRLQKSKKKTEKRQVAAKEKIKRIKGLIN